MEENNKTYRIRTTVGQNVDSFLNVQLDQDYDSLEILSLKISDKDVYKLHNSDYGVVVGRVLANGNFGVPNAKISVFIEADEQNSNLEMWELYPYTSTSTRNSKDIRYNLLPDESVKDCHKAVGTFPNKTYMLDNDAILEVFDKYYVYTTRTNSAGDYLICGVPTGNQIIHMDLDLSDCGILSQRPRDFVYKGYTIEQFENPNQFKKDENLDSLSQIFSQNQPVYVKPFWGNKDNGDEIGITRADIEIAFKFEPTCVFMGSAISDNSSNGVGKKCVPTNQMGLMEELTAGEGTIEMIRKTPGGSVEEFSIKGNQLINGNGVWCYQIPMNLDYMMTDEYGNMVPTDDPEKGIPTRTRVRFRVSLTDMENSSQSYYRAKYLVPNNPGIDDSQVDYNFGTYTEEDSYRDLFWNGVYTVKSYIPRFQKSKRWKSERFTGIKACNYYGNNNPMPYNNLRIKLPFMFTVLCIFVKLFMKIVTLINRVQAVLLKIIYWSIKSADGYVKDYHIHCTFIGDGLCPDMEGWYFAPGCAASAMDSSRDYIKRLRSNTLQAAIGNGNAQGDEETGTIKSTDYIDETSIDSQNISSDEEGSACVSFDVDYLLNCFEMNLAQEYRVIKFDFYNDWVNGVLYFPRWMRKVRRKRKYKISFKNLTTGKFITTYFKDKIFGCMNSETSRVKKSRYYTQQCSLSYTGETGSPYAIINSKKSCKGTYKNGESEGTELKITPSKCHKKPGMTMTPIFGKKSGLVTEETSMLGQFVYYLKPCEWKESNVVGRRTLLFATDIVLLGTLNDCDENGIPQSFKFLNNSSYIMPTNLALTTMDDDSYIYAGKNGAVCSSNKSSQAKNKKKVETTANRIVPNYETTNKAYDLTEDDAVTYENYDDPIAITESAGITWNYSGPGQDPVTSGKLEKPSEYLRRLFGGNANRYNYLYFPGGHFLGLSCVNSDTNIKSCVNLKRICEVGATMSQRREVMRSYTEGVPNYRYYVPTGLISNVDIEGASFRTMFATLNHKKLIATKTNETTGYKKYDFRFLRPDGFDGGLRNFIHKPGSPYNVSIYNDEGRDIVKDESSIFDLLFSGKWFQSPDYDPDEAKYTERRTIEDTVNDYYMFRFGLDGFSDIEQKKHYLYKDSEGYKVPQYENSFYFYFGLKDGSTALDEFKKQFFSECASNVVMKNPDVTIIESIKKIGGSTVGSAELSCSANIVISNMLAEYTIKVTDNYNNETDEITTDSDNVSFASFGGINNRRGPQIGHEYTVKVTDSLDQVVIKTFVFGSSAVKVNADSVNYRFHPTRDKMVASNPREGGFIKINKKVKVLDENFTIGNDISFKFLRLTGDTPNESQAVSISPSFNYTDSANENWYLYYMNSGSGQYYVYIYFLDKLIAVYDTKLYDNSDVNVFLSCDYMGYKPELRNGAPLASMNLRAFQESYWYNSDDKFKGDDWKNWLMRHTFYRQTQDDKASQDNFIYSKGDSQLAIFGEPEHGGIRNGLVLKTNGRNGDKISYYSGDYSQYGVVQNSAFTIDDKYSFIPTMYWNIDEHDDVTATTKPVSTIFRNAFDVMAYTQDGRAAASASTNVITSYEYSDADGMITLRGQLSDLVNEHGCIVVFENGRIIFPVKHGDKLVAYDSDVYPKYSELSNLGIDFGKILGMATVYPTMRAPQIYKPFYGEVTAMTWAVDGLHLVMPLESTTNETTPVKERLPLSYKVEGTIYNGLTWGNKFYGKENDTAVTEYETYLVNKNSSAFLDNLTADNLTRDKDYTPFRPLPFGKNSLGEAWSREVMYFADDAEHIDRIDYAVAENAPDTSDIGSSSQKVFTERYENDDYERETQKGICSFDQEILTDSCSTLSDVFCQNLKIKVYDASLGLRGRCSVYTTDPIPFDTLYYYTNVSLFKVHSILTAKWESNYDDHATGTCYGYYNENSEYDPKGMRTVVERKQSFASGSVFRFKKTNEDGQKIVATVSSLGDLYTCGITLYEKYVLKEEYRKNISRMEADVFASPSNHHLIKLETQTYANPADCTIDNFSTSVKTIIAKYVKPSNGTRNKMTVYRLYAVSSNEDGNYPVTSLDVMFPLTETIPYLGAPEEVTLTRIAQNYVIPVTTNVEFNADITQGSDFITGITKTSSSVTIKVTENSETDSRTGQIKLSAVDSTLGVSDFLIKVVQVGTESQPEQSSGGGDYGND